MVKFLIGLFSGVVLAALILYIAVPNQTFYNAAMALEHGVWVENSSTGISGYNYTFGHGPDQKAGGHLPTQINALTLASQTPIYTFDKTEIDRVCGQPSWYKPNVHVSGLTIRIFLKKAARNRLGSFLLLHPDENISLMYGGQQLNGFAVSTQEVNAYVTNSNDPNFTTDIYDPKQHGDFTIDIPESSLMPGFMTAFMIAGDQGFQHCNTKETLSSIVGYKEAKQVYGTREN